ncbi:hypothetical protein Bca52824_022313 [Brassica carinata]|uniref:Uncharacterized protein n=1 Tax=Brassica carinata TaxID=52824 RepID=A0A8X7VGC4_BRACI|nr:hypothetical protein Bca52824_022313 [Brassica carinata]
MVGLFVKPLFEAMVEQNKSLQSGAAISMGKMNKLQNLAGQRSDVLENLSPIVRARVDALKDIQMRGTICPTQNWDVISWSIWDHGQQAQCTRGLINDS